ncbi:hypothetical protein Rumeso_00675 [Rubellimicrobium mesophilum DSM 19309]|uniref:NADH:quinone oxidoreductase/Mrp antiporter transmembrane domain-containing protein n=1 Tax=Rubellimicrobium mesophilum DSM 19309 TaxID=442562 RepID=A0A017HT84_9RHOB|nr:proton-conducting transporter membrane subunit [Rubellimicrobium mesophilum]EYD77717.1 hypothetical protein Rumeso_00675 [Rubellimicrobium mesophilum DSM 19309]
MNLIPVAVIVPLLAAALLLALEKVLPKRLADGFALLVAIFVAGLCLVISLETLDQPEAYWFGGWRIQNGVVLGIAFVADPVGAGVAAFAAILFSGTFLFAWGFFGDTGTRFHVLMLVLLAAMVGFCLTGDLFSFFVFFELMSVTAFALTAYKLESASLEGALSFTVVNTIGSFLMLAGIGLLYGRTDALNLAAIGGALDGHQADALVAMALVLILAALLIKAAAAPFHFWLADAHAVAPTPVSVIFSGIMVSIALFGAARLIWTAFAPLDQVAPAFRDLLLYLGTFSSLLGGLACLIQRHVKRLLAFSTISHVGIMLVGLAALTAPGLAGMLIYLVGHGLVKGALFMGAGILMAECQDIDEIRLRGRAKHLPLTGLTFAAGALLLAGLPLGAIHEGHHLISAAVEAQHPWIPLALALGSALTGGAVLRATGRIFLGLGPASNGEAEGPGKPEHETPGRPVWLMLIPILSFFAVACLAQGPAVTDTVLDLAQGFADHDAYGQLVLEGGSGAREPSSEGHAAPEAPSSPILPWVSVLLALLVAGLQLLRERLPAPLVWLSSLVLRPVFQGLDRLHNGRIGDYAAWLAIGLALLGGAFVLP